MTDTNMAGTCTKCGAETGADWKTLCPRCWKSRTPEEVRTYRQVKLDKRLARMRAKADKLDKSGTEKMAGLDAHRGDIAFFTQPNTNNAKGRAFKRYRERLNAR